MLYVETEKLQSINL